MKPYYQDSAVTIYHGDCREILPQLGPVDLLLTDPPYGKQWARDVNGFGLRRDLCEKKQVCIGTLKDRRKSYLT